MNRRELLGCAIAGFGSSAFGKSGSNQPVQIAIDENRILGSIPRDFVGLGYEISSIARPGLLSDYRQRLRAAGEVVGE